MEKEAMVDLKVVTAEKEVMVEKAVVWVAMEVMVVLEEVMGEMEEMVVTIHQELGEMEVMEEMGDQEKKIMLEAKGVKAEMEDVECSSKRFRRD